MENCYLFDEKEIFVQEIITEKNFEQVGSLTPNNAFHIVVREWNPETWLLGPIYEVKVDKMIYASKFHALLAEKVFPHIDTENLYCCKVSSVKQFRRADLALKRWNKLKQQMTWIGQSTLEVNRDSVYVIVKDNSIKVREQLTDEEVKKYGTSAFMDHLAKKNSREI